MLTNDLIESQPKRRRSAIEVLCDWGELSCAVLLFFLLVISLIASEWYEEID